MKRKVLIIEPSEIIVSGLNDILANRPTIKLMHHESDINDIESRLAMLQPDVVIVNPTLTVNVPLLRGPKAAQVIALVYQYIKQSKLRHFDAVIDIRDSRATILQTVNDAADNSTNNHKTASSATNYELTKRETAVLIEVAKGLTNKEIAERLNVSVFTVTSHRKNIIRKTGIKSVSGLTVYALINNLIEEEDVT